MIYKVIFHYYAFSTFFEKRQFFSQSRSITCVRIYRLKFSPSRKLRYRNAPIRPIHLLFMAIIAVHSTQYLVKCLYHTLPAKLIVPPHHIFVKVLCLQATWSLFQADMCLNEVTQLPWHPSMRTMPKIQSWIYECDDKKCLEFLWWNPSPNYAEMSEHSHRQGTQL